VLPEPISSDRGKGTKIIAVADRHGLPVSICIESARPHEVKLATSTLVQMVVPDAPGRLIDDNAYDSDKLDAQLKPLVDRIFGVCSEVLNLANHPLCARLTKI
jgi:hypothetical protein